MKKEDFTVGLKMFIVNINTLTVTETFIKEINKAYSEVNLKGYKPIHLSDLTDHFNADRMSPTFVGQRLFINANNIVFLAFTEKECYQHIVNNVIPYQLICKENAAEQIIRQYNSYMEEVGDLEKLAEKIKAEKL